MNYVGGKARYGAEIAKIVRSRRRPGQMIREPFCGSCWVSQHLPVPLTCSDNLLPLIQLHRAVQKGWEPPDFVSEDEYSDLREAWQEGENGALIGFVGIAASWGGKWWGGYARGGDRNYVYESKKTLLEKHKHLKDAIFEHRNYKNLLPIGEVIYCDPPYAGTLGYGEIFDHSLFWNTVRQWSQHNTVIVSEYYAPPDFKIICEMSHFAMKGTDKKPTRERLYEIHKH